MIEIVNIFIWNNKAYLPVLGKTEVGFFWDTDILLTSELNVESLTLTLEEIVNKGNPSVPHPSQVEFRKPTSLQKILGMRSWKKMAQAGVICCVIYWAEDKIRVAFSRRNAQDIQEIDYTHQKEFSLDTPLRSLVEFILQEIRLRKPSEMK